MMDDCWPLLSKTAWAALTDDHTVIAEKISTMVLRIPVDGALSIELTARRGKTLLSGVEVVREP